MYTIPSNSTSEKTVARKFFPGVRTNFNFWGSIWKRHNFNELYPSQILFLAVRILHFVPILSCIVGHHFLYIMQKNHDVSKHTDIKDITNDVKNSAPL